MKRFLSVILSLLIIVCSLVGCNNAEVSTNTGEIEQPIESWYTDGPIEITEAELEKVFSQTYETPKNVIVMIGDGMGPNDLVLTEKYSEFCFDFGLVLNKIPYNGFCTTHSADNEVTDSAAAATALATGVKVKNGVLGRDANNNVIKNISEIARENGKKVGIVTNDSVLGATPSGFVVHQRSREFETSIANEFVKFLPDVLIGHDGVNFKSRLTEVNSEKLGSCNVIENFYNIDEKMKASSNQQAPLIAFSNTDIFKEDNNELAYFAEAALNKLNNDNGFFLMIENAATDKAGHSNNIDGKINGVIAFDRAVAAVLKFMLNNPDTLLIITSDHETGGVTVPIDDSPLDSGCFTTSNHTDTNVKVFAIGYGAEYFHDKTVDNTQIAEFVISALQK